MWCGQPKYRKLRICNPIFQRNVYNTGARGILLALGFEEYNGYMEAGAAQGIMLTDERREMFYRACESIRLMENEKIKSNRETQHMQQQPMGVDGLGRAGFGYAGSINRLT
jgi:hypothetical protein